MPAITKVVFYDDAHWPEQHEADEIVRVTVTRQPIAGGEPVTRRTELYLTGKHADELDTGLDDWFGVGHRQGSAPTGNRPAEAGQKASKNLRFGPQDAAKGSLARRDWWQAMRDWADSLGLVNPKNSAMKAYQTTTGKDYPPVNLAEGYTLHLGGKEDEAMVKIARFMPKEAAA